MVRRPSKTSLREMLASPEADLDGDMNAPALLLRKLLHSLSIKPMEWENLTTAYYRKKWGDDVKKIREEKSNLATSLESDTLTWSRFEQVLEILAPDSVEFTVSLNYPKDITLDTSIAFRYRRRGSKPEPATGSLVERMSIKRADSEDKQ